MASYTLTTNQKAPLSAADSLGNPVQHSGSTASVTPPSLATVADDSSLFWVISGQPGSGSVTFTAADGRSGSLDLTVVLEPLTITLGDPVAK